MGVDVLSKWKDVFSQSGIFTDAFIWVGWALTQGLKFFVDATQKLVDEMYKLIDFTSYAGIDKFFSTYNLRLFLGILFAFALVFLGITYIFQSNEKRPKFLQNLLIAVMVITALPSLMTMLNSATLQWKDYILSSNQNISDSIIADNIVDLRYIDSQGFNQYEVKDSTVTSPSGKAINGFKKNNAKNVQYINATEKVTKDDKKDLNSPDYFFNVLKTNSDGSMKVEELKPNKFFGFDMTEWYYRYHIDFLVIYIALIATGVAFVFMGYKVAKLIFDLAVHGFLAVIFSASDLTNGQRIKQILQSIGSIYITLALSVVMIKFFYLGQAFISSQVSNALIKAIALLFFAFAVIDGPNIIEKILGIDVGLKSGFQTVASTFMASKMVASTAHSLGKLGSAAVGGAAGAIAGTKEGISNFQSQLRNGSSGNVSNFSTHFPNGDSGNGSGTSNLYGDNQRHSSNQQNTSENNMNHSTDQENMQNQEQSQNAEQNHVSNPMKEAGVANAMAQSGVAAGVADQFNERNQAKENSNSGNQTSHNEQSLSENKSQDTENHNDLEQNSHSDISDGQTSSSFSEDSDNVGNSDNSYSEAGSDPSMDSSSGEIENSNLGVDNDIPTDSSSGEIENSNLGADNDIPTDSSSGEIESGELDSDSNLSADNFGDEIGNSNSGVENISEENSEHSPNFNAVSPSDNSKEEFNSNLNGDSPSNATHFEKNAGTNNNLTGDNPFGDHQMKESNRAKEPTSHPISHEHQNMNFGNLSGARTRENGIANLHTQASPTSTSPKPNSQRVNLNPNGIIGTGVHSYQTTKSIGGKIGNTAGKLVNKTKNNKNNKNSKGDKK